MTEATSLQVVVPFRFVCLDDFSRLHLMENGGLQTKQTVTYLWFENLSRDLKGPGEVNQNDWRL